LAETPSHPAYLTSYWSNCLGSQLMMTQASQRIDAVKLMHSGRVLPLFKPRLVPPPKPESRTLPLSVFVSIQKNRDYDAHPRQGIPLRKKNGREKTQTD
jgi:hypothetical protein